MKYEELSRALEFLDEDLLLEADAARTVIPGGGKHRRWKQFLKQPRSWISAACILLSVSLLAVTLLLGSMHGFYLGPLDTEYEVPEKVMEELCNIAADAFSNVPLEDGLDTISSFAVENNLVVLYVENGEYDGENISSVYDERYIVEGESLMEDFYKRTTQGGVTTLKIIRYSSSGWVSNRVLYFDGKYYYYFAISRNGLEIGKGMQYPFFLRIEKQGKDENGAYTEVFYYAADCEDIETIGENYGRHHYHVHHDFGKRKCCYFDHVGTARTYLNEK